MTEDSHLMAGGGLVGLSGVAAEQEMLASAPKKPKTSLSECGLEGSDDTSNNAAEEQLARDTQIMDSVAGLGSKNKVLGFTSYTTECPPEESDGDDESQRNSHQQQPGGRHSALGTSASNSSLQSALGGSVAQLDNESGGGGNGSAIGRRKIEIKYIDDKSRRHITFSKRKAGIMKKAYELSTLTGTQVLLLVASETGHVYTFATPKLQPLITKNEGKNLIQTCLNSPDPDDYVHAHQSAPNNALSSSGGAVTGSSSSASSSAASSVHGTPNMVASPPTQPIHLQHQAAAQMQQQRMYTHPYPTMAEENASNAAAAAAAYYANAAAAAYFPHTAAGYFWPPPPPQQQHQPGSSVGQTLQTPSSSQLPPSKQ